MPLTRGQRPRMRTPNQNTKTVTPTAPTIERAELELDRRQRVERTADVEVADVDVRERPMGVGRFRRRLLGDVAPRSRRRGRCGRRRCRACGAARGRASRRCAPPDTDRVAPDLARAARSRVKTRPGRRGEEREQVELGRGEVDDLAVAGARAGPRGRVSTSPICTVVAGPSRRCGRGRGRPGGGARGPGRRARGR